MGEVEVPTADTICYNFKQNETVGTNGDALGEHNIGKWVKNALQKTKYSLPVFDEKALVSLYWRERIRNTKILPCAIEVLEKLRIEGCIIVSVSGSDGIKSLKKRRISHSGLSKYFSDIIVVGEDLDSKGRAMEMLAEKYGYNKEECVFIDDKPGPINEVSMKGFPTIKVDFRAVLRKAWEEACEPTLRIKNLCEILHIII